jgi:hypothetical protein
LWQTTLRVWDVLFNEGAKVLFHVALAIFKVCIMKFIDACILRVASMSKRVPAVSFAYSVFGIFADERR